MQKNGPVPAQRAVVWAVLADVEHWSDWMPGVRSAEWERRGSDSTESRRYQAVPRCAGLTTREEILDAEPLHHQRYALLSVCPVKDYRADIYIDPRSERCLITWQATFDSRIPVLGNLISPRGAFRASPKLLLALAQEAERRS